MTTTTTTATPEPPEKPEPAKPLSGADLSESDRSAIADAVGVKPDLISLVKGDDYAAVRANCQKIADHMGIRPVTKVVDNGDKLTAAALAEKIRERMGYGSVKEVK
ncbi:hypothetical protein NE857_26835 [Nocardiopsis exhalans]|uniref:Uncharacterized protein n=1 Tax=Nocardiopsis exhalans TaxID=163604 RepID=A0ABY5D3B2_9ACTN|nr:hypothetical protein [Nocardiopsis exhalans]USY18859.1 hypothetical protein NE857_26835 [Nocardiopsis exhalans]